MIQELLGGGSVPNGLLSERKNSIPFTSSSTCPSSTPILTTTITTSPSTASLTNAAHSSSNNNTNTTNNNTNSEANPSQQNLRCPRCDSTNTKFCYYNNYNLTQPRHFCKTCRRYWTKGGTLRNVPIGGGCRKNKTITANSSSSSSGFVKPSPNAMAKAKATLSSELLLNGNPGNFLGSGLLDPELHSNYPNPIFWSSLPQNSHILSLLRGSNSTQFHNPNPNPNPNPIFGIKTENGLGLDSYGNGAPSNLPGSFSRANQPHINGLFSSGSQDFIQNNSNNNNNSNILELYQRLKSSSNYSYCSNDNPGNTVILGNMVGTSSALSSTILDSAPIGSGGDNGHFGGYHGLINSPALISGWSDIPTLPININGAYP